MQTIPPMSSAWSTPAIIVPFQIAVDRLAGCHGMSSLIEMQQTLLDLDYHLAAMEFNIRIVLLQQSPA